jgi:hypothetical protein
MADSLRLRDTTVEGGLRSATADAPLRSDSYIQPVTLATTTTLSVSVVNYDVDLDEAQALVYWTSSLELTSGTPSAGVRLSEVRINYSYVGFPEFWNDGKHLVTYTPDSTELSPYRHGYDIDGQPTVGGLKSSKHSQPDTRDGTHLGNWAYYSMFFKYTDSGANVYTSRLRTSSVLVPTHHNMAESMLARIPKYYRSLDDLQGSSHLRKFIGVFGWEADYFRSLVDELMVLQDPQRVHYSGLDRLAAMTGLSFTVAELRPVQMRELIQDSDRYFDQKGRSDALIDLLSVITDSEVSCREFATTGSAATAAYNRGKFTLSAGRLNLITNPRFVGTPSTSGTWNVLTEATSGSITVNHSAATGVTLTTDGSGAGTVYLFPRKTVQVKRKSTYYSSVKADLTNATAKVRLYREEPTMAGGGSPAATYFVTDHSAGIDFYKDLSLPPENQPQDRYNTTKFVESDGYALDSGFAEAHAVYIYSGTPINGTLFRARLYTTTPETLGGYTLKLTRVDTHPSSGSRFDRFDLAVHSGSANVITANNLTVNASNQVVDEDTSAVVTKLTNTTGGIAYTLLIDEVTTVSYAATTQLPSDDTSSYPFRDTGVEQLFPMIEVTLANSSSATFDEWIFQPFSNGGYFDGSILEGYAYLIGGSVVSDYYWSGTVNDSVSLYTTIRTRNRAAVRKVLSGHLPVTMSTELTSANYHTETNHGHLVAFDATPGDERAFDPHSWTAGVYTEGTIQTNSD